MDCRRCGKYFPDNEAVCPHCRRLRLGWDSGAGLAMWSLLGVALLSLGVASYCYHFLKKEQEAHDHLVKQGVKVFERAYPLQEAGLRGGLILAGLLVGINGLIFIGLLRTKAMSPAAMAQYYLNKITNLRRLGGYHKDYMTALTDMEGAPADDRAAILVLRATDKANDLNQRSNPTGRLDAAVRRGLMTAIDDLTKASALDGISAEWKWKAFFSIGQLKLRLSDFPGTVEALTQALGVADTLSPDFWHLQRLVTRGADERDKARLWLARGKVGCGDRAGAKADLLQLLSAETLTEDLRHAAEQDLQALA